MKTKGGGHPAFAQQGTMETKKRGKNAKKKGFKLTRQLVRMALNDGWTQHDIAKTCRTYQSIVSSWSKGGTLATEQQIRPLLEIYGHKLRRNSFRVYWNIDPDTQEKKFYRVEGKVIFAEAFYDARRERSGKLTKKSPSIGLLSITKETASFEPYCKAGSTSKTALMSLSPMFSTPFGGLRFTLTC